MGHLLSDLTNTSMLHIIKLSRQPTKNKIRMIVTIFFLKDVFLKFES